MQGSRFTCCYSPPVPARVFTTNLANVLCDLRATCFEDEFTNREVIFLLLSTPSRLRLPIIRKYEKLACLLSQCTVTMC